MYGWECEQACVYCLVLSYVFLRFLILAYHEYNLYHQIRLDELILMMCMIFSFFIFLISYKNIKIYRFPCYFCVKGLCLAILCTINQVCLACGFFDFLCCSPFSFPKQTFSCVMLQLCQRAVICLLLCLEILVVVVCFRTCEVRGFFFQRSESENKISVSANQFFAKTEKEHDSHTTIWF